ncbi:exported hypothetical protein [Desulfarculales bacterium]
MAMLARGFSLMRGAALILALALCLAPAPGLASGVKTTHIPKLVRQGNELYLAACYQKAQEDPAPSFVPDRPEPSRPRRAEAQYWLGLVYLGQGHQS